MNEITVTDLPTELLNCKSDFDLPEEYIVLDVNGLESLSVMNDQAVNYFLDEIIKKKKELHDPRHRCNRFFGEIRQLLIAKHGLYFSSKTLEKKYHYLKRGFDNFCQNSSRVVNGGSKGPISWPYFDKMMEIFVEELAIEDAPTMASLYPDLPLPKSALPIPQCTKDEDVTTNSFSEEDQKPGKKATSKKGPAKKPAAKSSPASKSPANESTQNEITETTWNHTVVLDFLNECVAKKDEFWDHRKSRQEILVDIQSEMQAKGYTFLLPSLDRKLKNFKTCYHGAIQTLLDKGMSTKGPHRWPYFALLDELYDGFDAHKRETYLTLKKRSVVRRKFGPTSRSRFANIGKDNPSGCKLEPSSETSNFEDQPTTSSNKYRQIRPKLDPFQEFHMPAPDASQTSFDMEQTMDENYVDTPLSPGDFDCLMQMQEDETETGEHFDTKTNVNKLTSGNDTAEDIEFAKRMLAFEERRTIATERLLEELKESNRIRERKLAFNQVKLLHLKAMAKRKEFSL